MRPNTYDDTKAYCLCKILVLPDEITCFSQDVQLLSACSDKFLTVQNDRIFANQNSESPQNFTIQSHQYTKQNMAPDIRITFYVKERGAYICFNQKWQPRLMKKKNLKDEHSCHFREAMDHGYSTFSSVKDPQKYLGFMRNGRPINYERLKNDEKCRRIFKRIIENSSNDVISNSAFVAYQETSTLSSNLGNRKSSSSRIQQKTHSNKIDMSKPRNTSRSKGAHPVRHHHNESPLRHPHHQHQQNNINSNNSRFNDSLSSNSNNRNAKHLDNENINTIYNNPSNNVNSNNNISDNNEKVTTHHIRHQHHRKMHQHQNQQSVSEMSPMNDPEDQQGFATNHDEINNENINRNYNRDNWNKDEIDNSTDNHSNNNSNNNSTSNCSSDDSDNDKHLKSKKNVRGRNAHANEKQQNNKCNNRKNKKNNENVRHSRKSNQKNSHKINRTPEN